eukprot:TRINITY_DN70774_c0_g1_i1.p1 TRINITY_DN70774_c0_g1~~TRINITY_DN70774_c0_g1_i1.p1  ORF type:complete len:131 (+),score=60.32 TRINITY_DN70774_c0_g1_i1:50-394(+)
MMRVTRRLLAVSQDQMHERLSMFFQEPSRVNVVDSSGGCGASFSCQIESPVFAGKTLPNQHKMVVACLKGNVGDVNFPPFEGTKEGVSLPNLFVDAQGVEQFHALTIKTKVLKA